MKLIIICRRRVNLIHKRLIGIRMLGTIRAKNKNVPEQTIAQRRTKSKANHPIMVIKKKTEAKITPNFRSLNLGCVIVKDYFSLLKL